MRNSQKIYSYKRFFDPEEYKKAYNSIKSSPGYMTPGVDGETIDGFKTEIYEKIIHDMKTRKFQFSPVKRVNIPKPDGRIRPLGISTLRDKLVQYIFARILEENFEQKFLDASHGYRPNRSCHTAILSVRKWNGCTWIIEGDLQSYFDTINHTKLAELLAKIIKDQNLIDLY